MRLRAAARRFFTGWGLPVAAIVFFLVCYYPRANFEVRKTSGWAEQGKYVDGASPLLLVASILMIVTVGSRVVRSFRAHR